MMFFPRRTYLGVTRATEGVVAHKMGKALAPRCRERSDVTTNTDQARGGVGAMVLR